MNRHQCSRGSALTKCHKGLATVQPFPSRGLAPKSLSYLRAHLGHLEASTYSYVVRSVKWNSGTGCFEQHGSAPNFQGGVLTLCTCKHRMRASRTADEWASNTWIAGFTGRTALDGKHWLFYLAKVESAHESHSELWNCMQADIREAKAADRHFLGDMLRPKTPHLTGTARYSPSRYYVPGLHAHHQSPSDDTWHNDICYRLAQKFGHAPLLVAAAKQTFIWRKPSIFLDCDHCRNYRKWQSLAELVKHLREPT